MKESEVVVMLAEAIDQNREYKSWHVSTQHVITFAKMIQKKEHDAVLETIDALYNSEDPHPMYQEGYNHALDHIKQFIEGRQK
jgi:hypothetical protein